MKPITIRLDDYVSTRSAVPVFTIGKLAVHYTTNNHPAKGWNITHIPTGYAARVSIRTKRKAITFAKILAGAMDWNFTEPDSAKVTDQIPLARYIFSLFSHLQA